MGDFDHGHCVRGWLNSELELDVLDREGIHEIGPEEAGFEYRSSRFMRENAIVLGAEMTLQPGDRQAIMDRLFPEREDMGWESGWAFYSGDEGDVYGPMNNLLI